MHALEHVCFAAAGTLYWWHLLSPIRSRHRLGGLGPVAYMLTAKVLIGLLGILLTFSPHALYAFYRDRPRYWYNQTRMRLSNWSTFTGLVM